VRVVAGVRLEKAQGAAHFDVSDNGTLVYVPGGPFVGAEKQLAWVDPSGRIERLPVVDLENSPRVSPDAERLLLQRATGGNAIWIRDLRRGVESRLTREGGSVFWAVWTPDGKGLVFNLGEDFPREPLRLFRQPADGSRPAERLSEKGVGGHLQPSAFSADGAALLFQSSDNPETGFDAWVLPTSVDGEPRPLLRERFDEIHPCLSPDGRWLAYASNESGRFEVRVRPYFGPGPVIQISANGGWEPIWCLAGDVLYYRDLSGHRIMAVTLDTSAATPRPGRPRVVVEGDFVPGCPYGRKYDLAPDGRFLVIARNEAPQPSAEYHVVLNWFEELKRLVPTN
jgi:Tol biopolymer transport system component